MTASYGSTRIQGDAKVAPATANAHTVFPPNVFSSCYNFIDLGAIIDPETDSRAVAINNSDAVLVNRGAGLESHVYVVMNGKSVDYGPGKGLSISDSDIVYGDGISNGELYGAVLIPSGDTAIATGMFGRLDPVGADSDGYTFATGVLPGDFRYAVAVKDGNLTTDSSVNAQIFAANASGTAVGEANNFPFVFKSSGSRWQLSVPNSFQDSGNAYAISSSGMIVGSTFDSATLQEEAQEWSNTGTDTELSPAAAGTSCEARGVNQSGGAVGWTGTPSHACIFMGGRPAVDLNSSKIVRGMPVGFTLDEATAINDEGDIVGCGHIGARQHAFVLTRAVTH